MAGDRILDGDRIRVVGDGLSSEAAPGDNSGTGNRSVVERRSENHFAIVDVEPISGGLDDGDGRGLLITVQDLDGDRRTRVVGVGFSTEVGPGDNSGTWNRSAVERSENHVAIDSVEPVSGGQRLEAFDDFDDEQNSTGGTCGDADTAPTGAPNPSDSSLTGNRSTTVLGRTLVRRPRILVVLDLHRRSTEIVKNTEVNFLDGGGMEDGTVEDDGGWKSADSRGDRVLPDPARDLRPIGVKSKFWALTDDDDSEDEIVQSPYTPDLVRQAAVHGFAKE